MVLLSSAIIGFLIYYWHTDAIWYAVIIAGIFELVNFIIMNHHISKKEKLLVAKHVQHVEEYVKKIGQLERQHLS